MSISTNPFSTCDFCDTYKDDSSGAFRALAQVYRNFGAAVRCAGPVVTVKCYEDNSEVKALLEAPGHGQVLVVDGGGSLRRALLGGNIGKAAAANGWAGVVVDGAVRDLAELQDCPIAIYALASVPLPTSRKNQGQRNVPVHLQGMLVRPGEFLYADADGIVVYPSNLLA